MTDRMIDLSDEAARLSVRNGLLVIQRGSGEESAETTLPLSDIAVVVVSNPCVSMSHAVLSGLASAGACLVSCDEKRLPVALLLPLVGHATQSERFEQQVNASEPTKKRLWQQIIKAKITAQGMLLKQLRGSDHGLLSMGKRVRSGDPDNLEAQATRKYWPALFADAKFRRDREAEDVNRLLNYGYAVLRATVARAVCASGLHPTIGIHHHNRYDAYCLADDLMEPFRPVVDAAAVMWIEAKGADTPLDKEAKAAMLTALTCRVTVEGESRTIFDAAARLSASVAGVFAGERDKLVLPEM